MDVSYFSGKLEAYLRYKQIPYQRIEVGWSELMRRVLPRTGLAKVPVVETHDGQWLQDTTPILDWMEARHPEPPILPADPYQAFFARLLEDYGDEWLWRPALHYRWSFAPDARLLGDRIAREVMKDVPLPRSLLAAFVRRRQHRTYVRGDGVTRETCDHVEGVYRGTLQRLERVLAGQPFLLGGRPSLADYGFFGSMFRHFSLDPTPARIMRDEAPGVLAWVARLWDARPGNVPGGFVSAGELPDGWLALVADAGAGYLEHLHANALAWRERRRRFDVTSQGVRYRDLPTVQYRVWCRERLQDHLAALPEAARARVQRTLEGCGALEPLLRDGRIASRLHEGADPPVCRPDPVALRDRLRATPWNRPGAFRG